MTRRDLLLAAAQVGGVNFAYGLMEDLGLVIKPPPIDLAPLANHTPKKATVLILGAGIAGLCAAYEFEQLGFRCVLLEARHRTGGRCVTIRGGDVVEESGPKQVCEFDQGGYFNPGPTRIPYWHSTIDYCHRFNVALAPWLNSNEGAYAYYASSGRMKGKKVRLRDVIADTTGYMAEIVARSVSSNQVGVELSNDEKTQALSYLRSYGFLDRDTHYRGAGRRSYKSFVGAGPGESVVETPYEFTEIFGSNMGRLFHFINANDQQMTMLEIVGGVDKLARAFEHHVRSPIHFGSEVLEINTSGEGVTVAYKNATGDRLTTKADFCVCTIPLPVLKNVENNFDAPVKSMVSKAAYPNSSKVATQYKRRFWEEDERIFGGISWTDLPISQVIYPCHQFFGKSGVLVNYATGLAAQQLAAIPPHKRVQTAVGMISQIHPQATKEFRSGVTLSWANVPYSSGAFAVWEFMPGGEAAYQLLTKPQGRLYFAGEHASRITAWMAGAIESARYAVSQVVAGAQAA